MPWVLKGSGKNGAWTSKDYEYYNKNRDRIWSDPTTWINPDAQGWDGFAARVERLASHYQPAQKSEFVRSFGLVFGGIPDDNNPLAAATSVAGGPHVAAPLNEGNQGLDPQFLDTLDPGQNQSHHYAGIFFMGYYTETQATMGVNYLRDTDNPGDIALGNQAARDAGYFHRNGTFDGLITRIANLGMR